MPGIALFGMGWSGSVFPVWATEPTPVITIAGRNWAMNMGSEGYADVAVDLREGFDGREYLSGEWGGAVDYMGAAMPMWLTRHMIFPDWQTNSNFDLEEAIGIADPQNPFNEDGNLVFRSTIANPQLRVTQWYDMRDAGEGVAQGQSAGGGEQILSDPDVFRHRIQITNISGQMIMGMSYYHLLHGLESERGAYDDEDYGGSFGEYRHDFSLRGVSFSFHTGTGDIWEHDDIFTLNSKDPPAAVQLGYYGVKGTDPHDVGKPQSGVHLDIETRNLSGARSFAPEEGGFVGAAARWDLGDLAPNESKEITLLASLRTFSTRRHGPVDLKVFNPRILEDIVRIRFRDREQIQDEYGFGFLLYSNRTLEAFDPGDPESGWEQLPIPYFVDGANPGRYWFEAPYDPEEKERYYIIRPIFATF